MLIPRFHAVAILLWLEALVLSYFALIGHTWLLPCAGFLFLFAALLSHGLLFSLPMAAAASVAYIYFLFGKIITTTEVPGSFAVIAAVLGTAAAFLTVFADRSEQSTSEKIRTKLGHITVIGHFICASFLFSGYFFTAPVINLFATALAGFTLLAVLEILTKLLTRLYTPRSHWPQLSQFGAFFFYRWLGPDWRTCLPQRKPTPDEFALKLSEMWMGPTVKRSLPWLALTIIALVFFGTCVHEIGPRHHGVRHSFGKWGETSLSPGVHLSLPAPFGGIQQVDTESVREIVLGFRADSGKPILWERAHYEGETMSIVGKGDDFLSISVPTHYRIHNPAAYLRSSTDVQTLLKNLGERILLRLTIPLPAADIMTTAREPLRAEFHRLLQKELDAEHSGVAIISVYFRDIHPPVEVAPYFQAVVSAMEDKEALIHKGESYSVDSTTRALGTANATLLRAQSSAEGRLARAKGDVSRFKVLASRRAENPGLYDLREGFLAFDRSLGGAKKVVFDEQIRSRMSTTLDMRRVLNPDFVSSVPPAPQSLVPAPSKRLDDFDRSIEGYLRTDRGELPAINHSSPNPDNLLDNP